MMHFYSGNKAFQGKQEQTWMPSFQSLPRPPYQLEAHHFRSRSTTRALVEKIVDVLKKRGVILSHFDETKSKLKADVVINHARINFRVFFYTDQPEHIVEFQRREGNSLAFNEFYFSVFEEMRAMDLVCSFQHAAKPSRPLIPRDEPVLSPEEGIDDLLSMIDSEFIDSKMNGVWLLARLVSVEENLSILQSEKVVDSVVSAFDCGDRDVVRCCAFIIESIAKQDKGVELMLQKNVHKRLEDALRVAEENSHPETIQQCNSALSFFEKRELSNLEEFAH